MATSENKKKEDRESQPSEAPKAWATPLVTSPIDSILTLNTGQFPACRMQYLWVKEGENDYCT